MTGSITKRIIAAVTGNKTKRVTTSGVTAEVVPVFSGDTWGGTWGGFGGTIGNSWGKTWFNATELIEATAASPAQGSTKRVTSDAAANTTKRITERPEAS